MITRERIKRIFNLEYYGDPDGLGQCALSEAIDRASLRILAELEPDKPFDSAQGRPKTLEDFLTYVFPLWERGCPNFQGIQGAVKAWLKSKLAEAKRKCLANIWGIDWLLAE